MAALVIPAVGFFRVRIRWLLAAAKPGGECALPLGQAPVPGERVAGLALGNLDLLGFTGLEWMAADGMGDMFARLGGILLLFEVGLIFANTGLGLSVAGEPGISRDTFSVVVVMVILTTMVTPGLLKWSVTRQQHREQCGGSQG